MIARRRSPKQPKREPPVTDAYRTSVLLEELRGQNQIVIEAVVAVGERLDRHVVETARRFDAIDTRFEASDARFDAIDARFDRTDAALAALRQDGRELAALVARKADAAALEALDHRVTRLERGAKL